MANEVWDELYERLAELIQSHRTTLIFVNNRRLAERATRHLADRVGAEHVATPPRQPLEGAPPRRGDEAQGRPR